MTAELKLIDKPTVQQATKARLVEVASQLVMDIAEGLICGMVCVAVRPDKTFCIYQSGDLRRIETIGMLETAKHDLMHEDNDPNQRPA
jgi:hypothetical protein